MSVYDAHHACHAALPVLRLVHLQGTITGSSYVGSNDGGDSEASIAVQQ